MRSLIVLALASATAHADPHLEQVAAFGHQVTGVTVSKQNRIFVNFPRWSEDAPVSVGEVVDGKVVPYPNAAWNAYRNAEPLDPAKHFVCVQSVVAAGDVLYVLDPASPAQGGIVKDGPKLVLIDLTKNEVMRTIPFGDDVAPQGSYLNDVRISPDGKTAYLTDSGAKNAIVVVELAHGTAHRVHADEPAVKPDRSVVVTVDGDHPLRRPDGRTLDAGSDGIALSADGKTLYFQALRGKVMYALPTDDLRARPQAIATTFPADGLLMHGKEIYVTSPQDDSIFALANGKLTRVLRDPRLRWPDTMSEGPDGYVYVTASHIQDSAWFAPGAPNALPTALFRFKP